MSWLWGIFGSAKKTSDGDNSRFDNIFVDGQSKDLDPKLLKDLNSYSGTKFEQLDYKIGAFSRGDKFESIASAQNYLKDKAKEESPTGEIQVVTKIGKNAHYTYIYVGSAILAIFIIGIAALMAS